MLNSLSHLDQKTADGVLASAVLSIGNPLPPKLTEEISAAQRAVFEEARGRLKIALTDHTQSSLSTIRSFLTKEIDRRLYAGFDRSELSRALGDRGDLPLSGYDIEVASDFSKDWGENDKFVIRCVRNADMVEHCKFENDEAPAFSIFAKHLGNAEHNGDILVIVAMRDGDKLRIDFALRIFTAVIAVPSKAMPSDLLKLVTANYGLKFKIRDVEYGPEAHIGTLRVARPWQADIGPHRSFMIVAIFKNMEWSVETEISLLFALDMSKYKADKVRFSK